MTISKRNLLVGAGSLTTLGLCSLGVRPLLGQGPRVRYEARSAQGQAMLQIYARAVQAMKQGTEARSTSWTFQWFTHAVGRGTKADELNAIFGPGVSPLKTLAAETWSTCRAHFGGTGFEPSFLPWHRAFVYVFEQIVRDAAADQSFTLPYWDYIADPSIPPEFRNAGGATAALYKADRNSWINTGGALNQNQPGRDLSVLGKSSYNPSFFGLINGFNDALDFGLHGSVHGWVGTNTNMARIPTAASDPIFWLHHCMIDRIWAAWNQRGRTNPTDQTWLGVTHAFADAAGNRVAYTNAQMTSTAGLNYRYDALPAAPIPVSEDEAVAGNEGTPVRIAAAFEVRLTGQNTVATLKPDKSPKASGRLFLKISKLGTGDRSPSVTYSVLVPASKGKLAIGTLQFFSATGSTDPGALAYEIDTRSLSKLPGQVEFSTTGTPDPKASPVIGSVELFQLQ